VTLPKILTPHETVVVEGVEVDVRSLTRAEASRFQKMVRDGASMADLEIAMLAAGTDTPVDEVKAWYEVTPSTAVDQIIGAIRDVTRLEEGAQKSG
jgi:hypothetical protein